MKELILILVILTINTGCGSETPVKEIVLTEKSTFALPPPRLKGSLSVEQAIHQRRSLRQYASLSPDLKLISQILWAAQGITGTEYPFRASPSAGATYPLDFYLFCGPASGLMPGAYRYIPKGHQLLSVLEGDIRDRLCEAGLNQGCIKAAPISIVITATFSRITQRYGDRGILYAYMEAGHAAQNILLQAEAMGLGGVPIGAFQAADVAQILSLTDEETPIYLVSLGYK